MFPAGSVITAVVGLRNTGDKDVIVRGLEASLRHPQEFSYHMYNVRRRRGCLMAAER